MRFLLLLCAQLPVACMASQIAGWQQYGPPLVQSQAMDVCEATLHDNPTSKVAQECERDAAIAEALRQRGRDQPAEALATLERAHHAIPGDTTVLLDLGIQAQSMHHLQRAAEALGEVLRLDPTNAKAVYALARVEFDRNDFPAAEARFTEYLLKNPDDATAHYGLGACTRWNKTAAKRRVSSRRRSG